MKTMVIMYLMMVFFCGCSFKEELHAIIPSDWSEAELMKKIESEDGEFGLVVFPSTETRRFFALLRAISMYRISACLLLPDNRVIKMKFPLFDGNVKSPWHNGIYDDPESRSSESDILEVTVMGESLRLLDGTEISLDDFIGMVYEKRRSKMFGILFNIEGDRLGMFVPVLQKLSDLQEDRFLIGPNQVSESP